MGVEALFFINGIFKVRSIVGDQYYKFINYFYKRF